MKKESKNLGQNKPCPNCKKTLITEANIETGTFKTKCSHCGSLILIKVDRKPVIKLENVLGENAILKSSLIIILMSAFLMRILFHVDFFQVALNLIK